MKKLIILNFTTGETDIYPVDCNYNGDVEEFLIELGCNIDNCSWMISEDRITFHKEVLK